VIIVNKTASAGLGGGGRSLVERGRDDRGAVTVHLAIGADLVGLDYGDVIDLRSPSLPVGRLELTGATLDVRKSGPAVWELSISDGAAVHPIAFGRARLLAAARGNVLVLEHSAGLVVFGTAAEPEVLGTDHCLDESGEALRLVLPDGSIRWLRGSPPPAVEDRVAFDPSRGSIRVFGPRRELLAELPRVSVTLDGGANGLFLHASFPRGLGTVRRPFHLLMPTDNRYMLRLE
jgi:hypothetical protein